MIVYGFAKDYHYSNDGTLKIQVRIPSIHGPYRQETSRGKLSYTRDEDLPWYTSVLLPHMPDEGEVLMLQSVSEGNGAEFVCIGLTGGSYTAGQTLQ